MEHSLPADETCESALDRPQPTPQEKQPVPEHPNQDFDYLDDLMVMSQESSEVDTGPSAGSLQSTTAPSKDTEGLVFLEWLRQGVLDHRLVVNDSIAKVHTVNGTFFLVTAGIFQRYAAEHPKSAEAAPQSDAWRRIQRQFEKLDVHLRKPNSQNIWTCTVRGPRKTTSLNGYILRDVNLLGLPPPPDNPSFLSSLRRLELLAFHFL
ncbi:conjugal transfer nickase/helicase domain-containing protein [Pseudomonas sp.]|uniref:conjugal transfer nickase/helicase domain-containing protein n=1 Tax=Pseudomonas sp. TaxID=306 RepID=UPI003C780734